MADKEIDWEAVSAGGPQAWAQIEERFEDFGRRMEDHYAEHRQRVLASKTNFIHDQAWLCWKHNGLQLNLCENPAWRERQRMEQEHPALFAEMGNMLRCGRFNGYVTFPKLPTVAPGYKGILTYVPVHGGITFCQDWWDESVTYGFDTGHVWSAEIGEIINDVDWMMIETESLAGGIQIAARFEPYYLRAEGNDAKARVLERMHQFLPLHISNNLGAMVNLLFGDL